MNTTGCGNLLLASGAKVGEQSPMNVAKCLLSGKADLSACLHKTGIS